MTGPARTRKQHKYMHTTLADLFTQDVAAVLLARIVTGVKSSSDAFENYCC